MKLIAREAPHIHHNDSAKTVMGDVILSLLPIYFISYCFYGLRAVVLGLISVVTCWVADIICNKLRGRRINFYDLSPVVTGMIIALMLPASIGYDVVIAAGLFAILVAKHPFGGVGQNIFNPAAAGLAFAVASWPTKVFSYPQLFEKLPIFTEFTGKLTESSVSVLNMGGVPLLDKSEMFLGILPGPMGATNILVIIACLIFLSYRKTISLYQFIPFVGGVAVISMLLPRVSVGAAESFALEIMSGSILFGGVFMLSDPATSPKRRFSRVLYGFIAGLLAMTIRLTSGFEQPVVFAILIMNIFSELFDPITDRIYSYIERRGKDAISKIKKGTQNT